MRAVLAPPTKLTVSEWADRYRVLSRESSAEPGRWRTDRAPYLRGFMDAFSDPLIEEVVAQWSTQSGKTESLNNVVGFYIDQEPAPMLVVQPNIDPLAKAWSTDRLAPMLRDTPRLRGKVREARSRDSGNTKLHKTFPGGHLTVAGANSAAGLAARPIRIVLLDEADRFPTTAGTEGDPVGLAKKRTDTFWNRKIGITSSPTLKGLSRIEVAMLETDRRRYQVPCPACDRRQDLVWRNLKWPDGKPDDATYECVGCGVLIEESQKQRMLNGGRWVAENPGARKAGFYLNALYSPWVRWGTLAREWIEAQGNNELLRVFINTRLAETWEERGEQVDPSQLRREAYLAEVPMGAGLLTMSADVQGDRVECEVRAWGVGEESWLVAHHRIYGDPEERDVWERLEAIRAKVYRHESGMPMRVRAAGIDSGSFTKAVYKYVHPLQRVGVLALKGISERARPIVVPSKGRNRAGVRVWLVGTDTAKDALFARLRIARPGPGYLHFPQPQEDGADEEYLAQFGAEKAVIKFKRGMRARGRVREYVQVRDRNEAIDLYCYSLATLHALGRGVAGALVELAQRAASWRGDAPRAKPVARAPVPDAPEPGVPDASAWERGVEPEAPVGRRGRRGGRSGWLGRY